jgi:ubiquinone/menaquinone biosynthesis C-methylase UbiE
MQTNDTIIQDKQSATEYDLQARKTNWLGPEVVFGLTYEFVKPGESVLDLGIGSGLSSILFHRAGLRVSGLDGSSEILAVCAAKGFAVELKQHDLRDVPLPYPSSFFNHVLSVAVLNSFRDLGPLIGEVARIVKRQGVFAFTVEEQKPGQEDAYAINRVQVAEKPKEESAVTLFRHSANHIAQLLDHNDFVPLKTLEFLAFRYPAENRDVFFKAYVAQKQWNEA